MKSLTLLSTIHAEIGKCNADELKVILSALKPEIIFLEALNDTYSTYEQSNFLHFGVLHSKLEISAIQKFSQTGHLFDYIPLLDEGLKSTFENKYKIVCESPEFQVMLNEFNSSVSEFGFSFINSENSIILQNEMRNFENKLLGNNSINIDAQNDIESYEDCMLDKIYSYSQNKDFQNGIFMCGVAHRQSIINKIKKRENHSKSELVWNFWTDSCN